MSIKLVDIAASDQFWTARQMHIERFLAVQILQWSKIPRETKVNLNMPIRKS
jgi:hypothetical protein